MEEKRGGVLEDFLLCRPNATNISKWVNPILLSYHTLLVKFFLHFISFAACSVCMALI